MVEGLLKLYCIVGVTEITSWWRGNCDYIIVEG